MDHSPSPRPRPLSARLACAATLAGACLSASAGGPFGIDHRINEDDRGIWKRRNQLVLQNATALVVVAGALWEGDGSRLGHTFWQSFDAVARVKVRAHWQSDVLASYAIGSAIGWYAHSRTSSLSVGLLPGGIAVGWKKSF